MLAKADFAGLQFLQQWEGHPLARLRWACIHLCTLFSIYLYHHLLFIRILPEAPHETVRPGSTALVLKGRLDPSKLVLSDGMIWADWQSHVQC